MQLTHGQRSIGDNLNPDFYAGRKLGEMEQALLWSWLQAEPECPSRVLRDPAAQRQIVIAVSLRQVNRWRAAWGLHRPQGRPGHADGYRPGASGAAVVRGTPSVACVGVHVFAHWLDPQDAFAPVVAHLTQAAHAHKQRHPDDDFALLHPRTSTRLHGCQALFYAPLLGIDRLSAFDTRAHPLQTLLGHGQQRATLSQFLGQLERVDAAASLRSVLVADRAGALIYVDGHRIASWSRQSMPKGKITMRGRSRAGSQAVIAHDDVGQAVLVAYSPPDIPMSQVIVAYCQQVAEATGSVGFVIDRAGNAGALAQAFHDQDWGWLCMLDDNEQAGRESFATTWVDTLEDGTRVQSGAWQEERAGAPRPLVMAEPTAAQPLVYGGTPQVKEAFEGTAWPRVYRERNEIQELGFKRMMDHGGLDSTHGRKTIMGPDRHHQRKKEPLAQSLETAHERVTKTAAAVTAQQAQGAASEAQGHGTRLEQRQGTLVTLEHELQDAKGKHAKLAEQVATWGPAGQRADRDFRKPTIRTIRTLFLENMLRAFMAVLLATLPIVVSLEQVLGLLFERRGARMETSSQVIYWVNTAGVSLSNRLLLDKIVEGLSTMDLPDQGKQIHIRLKDMPP